MDSRESSTTNGQGVKLDSPNDDTDLIVDTTRWTSDSLYNYADVIAFVHSWEICYVNDY